MKRNALCSAAAISRAYLQRFPLYAGKQQLWDRFIRPYLAWRAMTFSTKTREGVLFDGNTADTIQSYIYFFGAWEPRLTHYVKRTLSADDIVIDIGANIGYYSLLAARLVGPSGRVFAVEASPSICEKLRHHISLNAASNVVAINAAIFRERTELAVHIHDASNIGATTVVPEVAKRRDTAIEARVPAMPLAEAIAVKDIVRARLIKIDVEGAEWPVLQGMANLLPHLSRRTELLIEIDPEALLEHGTTTDSFLSVLADGGFSPYSLGEQRFRNDISPFFADSPSEVRPFNNRNLKQTTELLFRRV